MSKPKRAFVNKSKKARIAIALGGIVGNFILAIVSFGIYYSFVGFPRETGHVTVIEVSENSPAAVAGILPGDIIEEVDGESVKSTADLISEINLVKGQKVNLVYSRNGEEFTVKVTPRAESPEDEGSLGVGINSSETYFPPIWQRPFVGAVYGVKQSVIFSVEITKGLFGIAVDVGHGVSPKGVAGPVGILALIAYVTKIGILPLINFIGIFSINLAILNVIPFPPLDGSRVLFVGIEAVMGKKVLPKVESAIYTGGMVILLLLIVLMSKREIPLLLKSTSLSGFVDSILK